MTPACPGSLVLVLLLGGLHCVHAGRVLVIPGEFSHWQNMRAIVEELVERNHSVTVLVNTASPTVNLTRQERFHLQVFNVPLQRENMTALWDEFVDLWKYQLNGTGWQALSKTTDLMASFDSYISVICRSLVGNRTLVEDLRRSRYEVILTDPFTPCGDLVADALGVPFIMTLRITFGFIYERFCGQMPTLPSFVPSNPIMATDQMNFRERLSNFGSYCMHSAMFLLRTSRFMDNVYTEIRGMGTTAEVTEVC